MTNHTKVAAASETPRAKAASHNAGSIAEPHMVVDLECAQNLELELAEAIRSQLRQTETRTNLLILIRTEPCVQYGTRYKSSWPPPHHQERRNE